MARCYCHKTIKKGERTVTVSIKVEWADERGTFEKAVAFCSFGCAADWLADRSKQHDPREA